MGNKRFFIDMALGAALGIATGTSGSFLVPVAAGALRATGIGDADLAFVFTAGLSFGLGLGALLHFRFGLAWWKGALLTLLTPVLYYGALIAAVSMYSVIDIGHELAIPGLFGGLVGATLVASLTALFARPARWVSLIALTACTGALVGAIALPLVDHGPEMQAILTLHVPWHVCVLAVLLSGLGRRLGGSQLAGDVASSGPKRA